ncbi:MAG TPA: Ig-like domain-containing protein [Gaiellales bacterium]|jgi:lipoprotein-anchoring transpeptidase ErfK/SrfK|nr:Ig-like domain-containing protein [Gaiellales bacterium]
MRSHGRVAKVVVLAAAGACLPVAVAACNGNRSAAESGPGVRRHARQPAAPAARIAISPADHSRHVRPDAGITVRASGGRLTSVAVRAGGAPVTGRFNARHTRWHSRWALAVATRYTVRAHATDTSGRTVSARSSFRTLAPAQTFRTTIFEGAGQTYGVGMPVILTFSRPITHKRAIERSLQLTASKPVVGAWYWDGSQTLYFRPRSYWRPHTRVRFVGHLNGVEGAPGVWGVHTLTQRFQIGQSLIAVANTLTHDVRVYLDRRLYADWPMSSGRPGDDTPNGTYLTIEKHNPTEMKGPGYDIEVPWSVRFTWSGDYLHDAFWSVGEQGFTNVSHGCVNLSPEHARTYYLLAVPGEPVTITGSPRGGAWGNGWTVWFLSWRQLLAGSALHAAVVADAAGSRLVRPRTLAPSHAKPPLGMPRPGNDLPT